MNYKIAICGYSDIRFAPNTFFERAAGVDCPVFYLKVMHSEDQNRNDRNADLDESNSGFDCYDI
jgi:hypothetical protein